MRESFILYTRYTEQLELLNMEQRGVLFTAIMNYQSGIDLPDMDSSVKMAFSFIKNQLDADTQKYHDVVAKRQAAGRQGGRPRKVYDIDEKQTEAKKANGFSEKQTETKKGDNVYDNDIYINNNQSILDYKEVENIANTECPTIYFRYKRKVDMGDLKSASELLYILEELQGRYSIDDIRKLFKHVNKTYITSPKYTTLDLLWVLNNIEKVKGIIENDDEYRGIKNTASQVTTKSAEELNALFGTISPEDI